MITAPRTAHRARGVVMSSEGLSSTRRTSDHILGTHTPGPHHHVRLDGDRPPVC